VRVGLGYRRRGVFPVAPGAIRLGLVGNCARG